MSTKLAATAAVMVLVGGCDAEQPGPTDFEVTTPVFVTGGNTDFNLGTHLSGDEEVFSPAVPGGPTPADSRAQGQAIFRVSDDGATVDFRLIAANIHNVTMAHIHCGRPGANGPISMWLYPVIGPTGAPVPGGSGRHAGVLASGTFSPVGVVCPAIAVGTDTPLLDAMRAGLTYVNVHTSDGAEPPNTGPGDFPGGEIRGQIDRPGAHSIH
jgi:hypothetical protein